eukprot:scaffold409195_cov20-Prasinocladus_malaysianus.AAC.1
MASLQKKERKASEGAKMPQASNKLNGIPLGPFANNDGDSQPACTRKVANGDVRGTAAEQSGGVRPKPTKKRKLNALSTGLNMKASANSDFK